LFPRLLQKLIIFICFIFLISVHQDNNLECVTKLPGITVPNALRSIKGNTNLSCPVAVFEPPDPTKRPMYCKDKVSSIIKSRLFLLNVYIILMFIFHV